jgi:hypothetical protein
MYGKCQLPSHMLGRAIGDVLGCSPDTGLERDIIKCSASLARISNGDADSAVSDTGVRCHGCHG